MGRQSRISWRRNKVSELLVYGRNQYEIASILKISQSTVNNDIKFLKAKARENVQTHIEERLPEEFENCLAGINQVLKMSWEIANRGLKNDLSDNNSNSNGDRSTATAVDDKTRLQALQLANESYKYKIDLITNGVVITDAIKFVEDKKSELIKITESTPKKGINRNQTNEIF